MYTSTFLGVRCQVDIWLPTRGQKPFVCRSKDYREGETDGRLDCYTVCPILSWVLARTIGRDKKERWKEILKAMADSSR